MGQIRNIPENTIFDLHCDTVVKGAAQALPSLDRAPEALHIDFERLSKTPRVQCLAIFCPDNIPYLEVPSYMEKHIAYLKQQIAQHSDLIEQACNMNEAAHILTRDKTAALYTIENARAIVGQIKTLQEFAQLGIKMMTLTWNSFNAMGSGNETSSGLTTFAREAVREMENLHIAIDISHLNQPGFMDLLDIAEKPFTASHSNTATVCPHPRNLTDYQIEAIIERNGLIGLTLVNDFISLPDQRQNPHMESSFDDFSRHIEHVLNLAGENNVALGTDYDGAEIPSWIADTALLPQLFEQISSRFGSDIAQKMAYKNAVDFFTRLDELS